MKKISVLMLIAFVDMLGYLMIVPLLPFYGLRLGAEPWLIGLMLATYPTMQIVSAPIWGRVSDRHGRRPALLIGLSFATVGFFLFGVATSVLALFVARMVHGAGGGTTAVAQAYVGDTMEAGDRAKALGWLSAASSAGVMLGPALGSLATRLSFDAPGKLAAALCLLNLLIAWLWLPETVSAADRAHGASGRGRERRPVRELVWTVLRRPFADLSRLIWIYAVGMLGFMSITAVTALYLGARFGIDEKNIGLFFLYVGALAIVMRGFLLGRLVGRFGEIKVLRIGAVLLAIGFLTMPLASSALGFALVMSFMPIGTACLFPTTTALVSRRAVRSELGQVLGVQQAFGGAARVLAPIWATAAFQGIGPSAPFLVAGLIVGLVALMAVSLETSSAPVASGQAVETLSAS